MEEVVYQPEYEKLKNNFIKGDFLNITFGHKDEKYGD